jgi:DNA-directed RNA polymerase subunit F
VREVGFSGGAGLKVKRKEELTLARAKELLEEVQSKWGKLKYFQQITLDYLTKFSKLPADKAEELVDKLCKDFGLSRAAAIQVVNIMPESIEELRQLLIKEGRAFLPEELNEVRKHLEQYLTSKE